jgi:hypothetical protein
VVYKGAFFIKKEDNGLSVSEIVVPLHADYYHGGLKMPSMHVRIACSLARQSSSVKACRKK